jgi:hypothetical protein
VPRRIQLRNVRPVHFIPTKRVEVRAERAHVDGAVGREGDGVDAEECVGDAVDGVGDGADVGDGAENVGGVRAGDEGGVWGEQGLEGGGGQVRSSGGVGGRPKFEGDVESGGEEDPGGDVGFVVDGAGGGGQLAWRCWWVLVR